MEDSTSGTLSEGTNPDMNTIMEADGASISSSDISVSEGTNPDIIILMEADSASSAAMSEGTNPDMNTITEANRASISPSNISVSEGRNPDMNTIMEADSASISSSNISVSESSRPHIETLLRVSESSSPDTEASLKTLLEAIMKLDSARSGTLSEGTHPDMDTNLEADGASISSSNINSSEVTYPDTFTILEAVIMKLDSEYSGRNPGMNTIKETDSVSTSFSNISVGKCVSWRTHTSIKRRLARRRTVKADIASKVSSNINIQQNVAKMKILMETWCRFIDSRAKHNAGLENFELHGSVFTIEELSDHLNSTHDNLRASKSRIQIAWEHFPYKGPLKSIFLVVLMLSSFLTLLYGDWRVGLVGLLSVPLSIYYYFFPTSRTHSTRFKNDWIYTSFLKLRLKLWKIPPSAPDNDMLNPKCIYVPLNKHQAGTWGEWLHAVILPKLRSELGITDMKGLDSTIKNAECSLNDFQKYSLWADVARGPLDSVPPWFSCILVVVCLPLFTMGALYYENAIVNFFSLSGVAAIIKLIYGFVKSNKESIEPDIEANVNVFDVICRLHRVMKKETIFFAVVANELDDFNVIPIEYRRYFKFLISCDVETRTPNMRNPFKHYVFNMDCLKYNDIKDGIRDSLADIIFNYIINKRFITESENDENMFEFLRLLHKINNDNNNVLSNRSMLHLVYGAALLSYSESVPGASYLRLHLLYNGPTRYARISHVELQAMGLYTTQTKLLMEELKNRAGTSGGSWMVVSFYDDNEHRLWTSYKYFFYL